MRGGVEHWDVIQPVPTEGLANDNGMFTGFDGVGPDPIAQLTSSRHSPANGPRPSRRDTALASDRTANARDQKTAQERPDAFLTDDKRESECPPMN